MIANNEAAAVVRVDSCGEIYVRLAEAGEVEGPLVRLLPDDEGLE